MAADPNAIADQYDTPVRENGKVVANDRYIVHADGRIEIWRSSPGQDPEKFGEKRSGGYDQKIREDWQKAQEKADAAANERRTVGGSAADKYIITTDASGNVINTPSNPNYTPSAASKPEQFVTDAAGNKYYWDSGKQDYLPFGQGIEDKPLTPYEQRSLEHQAAMDKAAEERDKAQAVRDQLAKQVELGKLKATDALNEYNRYIQEHITTPLALSAEARARAAEERQQADFFDRQQQERVTYEQKRQEFALGFGQEAVANYLKQMPYMVGPAFGGQFANALNVLGTGKGKIKFTGDAFTYDLPDLDAIAKQHVAEALANVSPAAQAYLDAGGMLQPSKPVQYPTGIPSADLSGAPAPYHASDQFDQNGNYIGP